MRNGKCCFFPGRFCEVVLRRQHQRCLLEFMSLFQVTVPISIKEAGGTTLAANPISTVSGTPEASTAANSKMGFSGPTMAEASTP